MYWNRSAADITAAWQADIESKLEAGATAVLLGGVSSGMTTGAAALLALQNSAIQRNDVSTPLLVAGGNSAPWLGMLLPPQPVGSSPTAPQPMLIFGGADEATYLAVVGLTAALAAHTAPAPGITNAGTPQEVGVHFAPRLHPGAPTAWEMLPFAEVGEQPAPSLASTIATPDPTTDWIAWGIMLLVLCLVLSAFLI